MRDDDFLLPREARLAEALAEMQGTVNDLREELRESAEKIEGLIEKYQAPGGQPDLPLSRSTVLADLQHIARQSVEGGGDQGEQESIQPVRCGRDAGTRPSWMSPYQYDPCPCVRPRGHDGKCGCADHDKPADAVEGGGER